MVQFPNVPLQGPSHSPEPAAQAGGGWRREEEAFPRISGVMEASQVGTEPASGEGVEGTKGRPVAPGRTKQGGGGLAEPVEETKLFQH